MKILLLSPFESIWTRYFIEEFLLKGNYEVWMLKPADTREYRQRMRSYRQKGIHFIDCCNEGRGVYKHFRNLLAIFKAGRFDIVNLQYVEVFSDLAYAMILKSLMKSRVILSYWGSDLLRHDRRGLSRMGALAKYADFVTFDNRDLEKEFRKLYKWADRVPAETVLFGLCVLDRIKEKAEEESPSALRRKWGNSR